MEGVKGPNYASKLTFDQILLILIQLGPFINKVIISNLQIGL
jgi:hypothetical protein